VGSQDCHVDVFYASPLASGELDCDSRHIGRATKGAEDVQVDDVTTEFVVDDGSSRGRVTVFQLTWRSCDPLAVTMELVSRPEHPALPQGVWVAPRDSLRAGLDSPVGDGDVRITPEAVLGKRPAGVRFDLADGDRQSVVMLEAAPLRSFLDRTESVVPAGEEHPELELDEVLIDLLGA
jgi:hypothetical protein